MKRPMFTVEFWAATGERAVKTFAQAFVALALAAGTFDVLHADWITLLSVSAGAALISVLTSIGSTQVGDPESPALQNVSPETIPGGPGPDGPGDA